MSDQRVRRRNPNENDRGGGASAPADLRDIARLAARLSPEHGDPERFYLRREEVVSRLYALAGAMEGAR